MSFSAVKRLSVRDFYTDLSCTSCQQGMNIDRKGSSLPQRSLLPGNADEEADLLSGLNTYVSCVPFNPEGNMHFWERHLVSGGQLEPDCLLFQQSGSERHP